MEQPGDEPPSKPSEGVRWRVDNATYQFGKSGGSSFLKPLNFLFGLIGALLDCGLTFPQM